MHILKHPQMDTEAKTSGFLRLVFGDLTHIGDAMEVGRTILFEGQHRAGQYTLQPIDVKKLHLKDIVSKDIRADKLLDLADSAIGEAIMADLPIYYNSLLVTEPQMFGLLGNYKCF